MGLAEFVEEIGIHLDRAGLPPMAGRVLGHLLVSEPAEQSAADLEEALGASKGAISMTTSLLMKVGLVERTRIPGDRRGYFVIREGIWTKLLHQQVEQTRAMRELADRGLAILADCDPARRRRLEELRDLHAFYEREFPLLLEKWEASRREAAETTCALVS
jgi:DNA-binding transcriptional regulator GbsR (MarR family)